MLTRRHLNLIGIALAAFGTHGAMGQTSTSPTSAAGVLEEIIVTAEKIRADLQKTPVPLQVISGAEISQLGIFDAAQLNRVVPGLVAAPQFGGTAFFIRGVGSGNSTPLGDEGVDFAIDGVFFSREYGQGLTLFDLDSVEVLKGPQGTLYGRNATGGVINVITQKPVLGENGGNVQLEVGNYGEARTEGGVNIPIADTLAARVSFQTNKHDGYLSDGYDDADTKAARLSLLWLPNADLSVLLTGNYMHDGSKGQEVVPYIDNHFFVPSNPWSGGVSGPIHNYFVAISPLVGNFGGADGFPLGTPYAPNNDGYEHITVWDLAGNIEYDLGPATLTIVPGYLRTEVDSYVFTGTLPQHNNISIEQGSLEVRLHGTEGPFKWIAGTFWQDEKQNYRLQADFLYGVVDYSDTPDVSDRNYAGFAQATYSLRDDFRLTGGIRYTYEEKSETGNGSTLDPLHIFGPDTFASTPVGGHDTFNHVNYKAGVEYDLGPQSFLYANIATGFHAGGIEPGVAVGPNPSTFAPETLTAYTLGLKNRFFNDTLQFNIEGYYWKYDNLQVQALGAINEAGGTSTEGVKVFNAGAAHIEGFDTDVRWLITRHDQLSFDILYTNAVYVDFYYVDLLNGPTNDSGRRLPYVAPWTETIDYLHSFDLPNGGKLEPAVHSKIQSRTTLAYNTPYAPDAVSGAYTRTDINLTYYAPGGHWSIAGYVRNVEGRADLDLEFGTAVAPGVSTEPIFAPGAVVTPGVSLQAPRTFGAIINYAW
jgi:iron complex outermembrane receptor protein